MPKVAFEVILSEINIPLGELDETIDHLQHWMEPESIATNMAGENRETKKKKEEKKGK